MVTPVMVNGTVCDLPAVDGLSLLWFLRDRVGLTGTKPGCGEGECGACTVLLDGEPVFACQTGAADVDGRAITTIEGLAGSDGLHPVQVALLEERASQCGYCTPAMALRAAALLERDPSPDDDAIAAAMDPNLCRCGTYLRLHKAVRRAAAVLAGDSSGPVREQLARPAHDEVRPARPWDKCEPAEREWFDFLGDGLVVVWPVQEDAPFSGGAWLHVSPSGAVTAFSGKVDVGQDNTTAFRVLVAEEMGVSLEDVRVALGDTDFCPFDMGTFGSRSMPDSGQALRRAAAGARAWLAASQLTEGARHLEVLRSEPALRPAADWAVVGRDGHCGERVDAVTGARLFASDIVRPNLGYGAVLRPPVAGATLRGVDTAAAEQLAGVRVVVDGEFVGVVADDTTAARVALAAIDADWDIPEAGPGDIEAHLRTAPVEPQGWERAFEHVDGDPGAALAAAPTRLDATYTTAYIAHVPLETRAAVAEWDGARVTVWTGTQGPFGVRGELAYALGIPDTDVRVIVPATGGAFGGKHRNTGALEAARLARATGRPVKVHWTRAEEFLFAYARPMAVVDIHAGLTDDGEIAAWDFTDTNAGAAGIGFPYRTAAQRLRALPADSPLVQGSYRALAATANTFARESHIDELAYAASADPVQFRFDHLADDRLAAVLRAATESFGWRAGTPGAGVAVGMEKGGRVATCVEVEVDDDDRGEFTVQRIVTAYDCGAVVNPDTVRSQIEGGLVMALGGALFEQLRLDHGRLADPTLRAYPVPRFRDVPAIDVVLVDRPDRPSAGAGEAPLIALAPAIANALRSATGERRRSLPLRP